MKKATKQMRGNDADTLNMPFLKFKNSVEVKCKNCRYFRYGDNIGIFSLEELERERAIRIVNKQKPYKRGFCFRFPSMEKTLITYYCGEFKPKAKS